MIKMTSNFILIGLIAISAVWLADSGGMVSIEWIGYKSQISMSMFVALIFAFSFLFLITVNFISGLCKFSKYLKLTPGKRVKCSEYKKVKNLDNGIDLIVEIVELISSGDMLKADKKMNKIKKIFGSRPSIDLLAEKIEK